MVHAALCLGLVDKFAVKLLYESHARGYGHRDGAGGVAVAIIGDEKFLDGHRLIEHDMSGEVGAAEASFGEEPLDAVGAVMEESARCERCYPVFFHCVC